MDEKKKKTFKINHHILFLVFVVVIVGIMVWRLNNWNKRSIIVDTDVDPNEFKTECLDYYVYPDPNIMATREDDGVNTILVIGDSILTNSGAKHSILNELTKKLDGEAVIYPLVTDTGRVTSALPEESSPNSVVDSFSLYRITKFIALRDSQDLFGNLALYPDELYRKNAKERADECVNTMASLDMNTVDCIIIMYSFQDYLDGALPLYPENDMVISTYYGALAKSIQMLQDAYPFINIIVSSPYPIYFKDSDGTIKYGDLTDRGKGNTSAYLDLLYFASTKYCTSYIDNYFYVINEDNLEEYVGEKYLTNKGIDLVTDHIVSFLRREDLPMQ